ncbi:363_t:CDS:1, partial [Gigaspora rosea]
HALQNHTEWFLVEETNDHIIETSFLIQKIVVWLKDQPQLPLFNLLVSKILYYFTDLE